ncbi:MAG: hypothetical protein HOP19_20990 [Acidobacteria bacterium]|nr:hypothetical protein [Acidobacteriota bacterium]
MPIDPKIQKKVDKLNPPKAAGLFAIRYAFRNPAKGEGVGLDGIADEALIRAYIKGLNNVQHAMTTLPWKKHPFNPVPLKVRVFVADFYPPGMYQEDNDIYILLPSGTGEPDLKAELLNARITAIHEGFHAIISSYYPANLDYSQYQSWAWIDEGTAVYMESRLVRQSHDYYRYLRSWICQPEAPLDEDPLAFPMAPYRAVMFIKYLDKLFHEGFVDKVWCNASTSKDPFEVIRKTLPAGYNFLSGEHDDNDIFASYCLDAYFLADPNSCCFDENLHKRFGERAIAFTFNVSASEEPQVASDTLDHLACRYYKIVPLDGVRKITVRLKPDLSGETPLRAQLVKVKNGVIKGEQKKLMPKTAASAQENSLVLCEGMELTALEEVSHLILVVSNHAATRRDGKALARHLYDEQRYSLEIIAE